MNNQPAQPYAECACCLHCSRQAKGDNPPFCDILGKLGDPYLQLVCKQAGYRGSGHKHAQKHYDSIHYLQACGQEGWER